MFLLFIAVIASFFNSNQAKRLVFVQCVTRHGVRYPSYPNNYDFSNITAPDMKSQLTAEGKQMLFLLGRKLYNTYWKELFRGTQYQTQFDSSLIYAKSTNRNRTIQSLQHLLAGFLTELQPDLNIEKLNQNKKLLEGTPQNELLTDRHYQSWKKNHFVPIHVEKGAEGDPNVAYMKNEGDFLVKQELNLCPNQEKWGQQNLNSSFVANLMKEQKIKNSIKKLKPYFQTLPLQFSTIYQYVDNYYCLKAMGKQYLQIFEDPNIKSYLDFFYIARLYVIYAFTETQIKTFSKTILQQTINNMKQALAKEGPPLVFYSGHDITIAFLLSALNFTNVPCLYQTYILNKTIQNCYEQYPKFGSAFIIELYQEDNATYSIQISINGKYYPIPICNYSQNCPLIDFERWFKNWTIKESPNKICGVNTEGSYFYQLPLSFAFGMAFAYVLFFLINRGTKKRFIHENVASEQELG